MKKHNILVTVNGVSKSRAQWAKELGVTKGSISHRESKGESASSAIAGIIGTVHTRKILEHYTHAKEKHPYFCDIITCLSESGADTHLDIYRSSLKAGADIGCVEADTVLICEFYEALQAYKHGDTAHAVEELYDTIAVCLRTIDVLEGQQKLGKPETKGENKC